MQAGEGKHNEGLTPFPSQKNFVVFVLFVVRSFPETMCALWLPAQQKRRRCRRTPYRPVVMPPLSKKLRALRGLRGSFLPGNFVRFVVARTTKAASLPPHSIGSSSTG
jgi:hypothetical protein